VKIQEPKIETRIYFHLKPLLKGLEPERPGISKRVTNFIISMNDNSIREKIKYVNLFYCGIGNEYETNYLKEYPGEYERSKTVFPDAFIDGSKDKELRLDLNLIQSTYDSHIHNLNIDIGSFPIML